MRFPFYTTKDGAVYVVILILLIVACCVLSWIITCGMFKLITMCFGLTYKWSFATGVWLILCLLKGFLSVNITKK